MIQVQVCSWNSCSSKFSKYISKRIENDISFLNLKNINLSETLCTGSCKKAPVIQINWEKHFYVSPVQASELLDKKYKKNIPLKK